MTLGPGGPRARGQREGIVAATEQGVWRWVSEPVHVVTKACEAGPGMGGPAGKGEAERASLVRLAGGQRIPVVAPDATTDVSELTSSVTVVGTVGPYWFVREATFIYACGAHGSTGMSAAVIDARGGARVEVLSAEEKAQVDRVERRDALEKVRADKEAGFGEIDAKDLQLAAFLPGWKDGALAMRVQFAAPACYACTDGEWSSYTRSTFVPLRAQPRSLTPYARMPAEIAAHAREAKITVRGWSEVPAHAGEVAAMAEFFGGRR
jgi:hypothetical protein